MSTKSWLWVPLAAICALALSLWLLSFWWERKFASLHHASISPKGCYRLEAYEPFWILPDILHPKQQPDPEADLIWLPHWEVPGFYRLYDNRDGRLLSESGIYDLEDVAQSWTMFWGDPVDQYISRGMVRLGKPLSDCSEGPPN